jgi:hypothetical protein
MESIESGLEGKDFTGEFVRDDEGNVRLIGTRKRIIGDLIAILRPTEMQ